MELKERIVAEWVSKHLKAMDNAELKSSVPLDAETVGKVMGGIVDLSIKMTREDFKGMIEKEFPCIYLSQHHLLDMCADGLVAGCSNCRIKRRLLNKLEGVRA